MSHACGRSERLLFGGQSLLNDICPSRGAGCKCQKDGAAAPGSVCSRGVAGCVGGAVQAAGSGVTHRCDESPVRLMRADCAA
eukprot:5148294-Prymnesium_polylepis.1